MKLIKGFILLNLLISSFSIFAETENTLEQSHQMICSGLAKIAGAAMFMRQDGLSKDVAKIVMEKKVLNFKNSDSQNDAILFTRDMASRLLDDAYQYPLIEGKAEKQMFISNYQTKKLNLCNSLPNKKLREPQVSAP